MLTNGAKEAPCLCKLTAFNVTKLITIKTTSVFQVELKYHLQNSDEQTPELHELSLCDKLKEQTLESII